MRRLVDFGWAQKFEFLASLVTGPPVLWSSYAADILSCVRLAGVVARSTAVLAKTRNAGGAAGSEERAGARRCASTFVITAVRDDAADVGPASSKGPTYFAD